ncbi:DUF4426 domain-containing protein [Ningiella sp. W23]|uniref:DUF4426 domain-containing protein n=1 Tax=Ningiella sp. W23 TaxID=3023715 RepID=UPI0037568812
MKYLAKYFAAASSLVILTLMLVPLAQAEQKKVLGNWDVHYIAIPSTFLTPEVARANGIVRSSTNALVNISVLDSTSKKALDVDVSGSARNLLGTNKTLEFKTVKEGEAIYHLASVSFDDKEVLRFNISITDSKRSEVLQFQQKMYEEE